MLERINLVPAKPIAGKLKRAVPLVVGLLLAVILLFLAGKYLLLNYRLDKMGRMLAAMQTQVDRATQFKTQEGLLTKEIASLNNQVMQLKTEVTRMSVVRPERKTFSGILARIAAALPGSMKCSTIALNDKGGEIKGMATEYKDLPDFVASLKKDRLFKQAILHDIDRSKTEDGNRFSYKITLELN